MTDKDLKRLRRDELLEMLIAQSKRTDQLQAELDAAQAAAEQYLENIRRMSGPLPGEAQDQEAPAEDAEDAERGQEQ